MGTIMSVNRPFFAVVMAISAAALASALTGEHVFGLEPCILCLYERVPYVLAGLVAAAMLGLPTTPGLRRLGAALILAAFLAGVGLSAYHVGVEQHWWASAVCEAGQQPLGGLSGLDLREALTRPQRPACDQVAWTLFGVSLAGYNLILSLGLSAFVASAIVRSRRKTTP